MRPQSSVRTPRTSSFFLLSFASFLSLVALSRAAASYTRIPAIGGASGTSSGDGGFGTNAKINPIGIEAFTTYPSLVNPALILNERCTLRDYRVIGGRINNIAGDGTCNPTVITEFTTAKTVSFNAVDVAFDAFGYLYMASKNDIYNNNQILKFDLDKNKVSQIGAIPQSKFIEMNYDGSVIFFIRESDGMLYSKNLNTRVYTFLSNQVSPDCDIAISSDDQFIFAADFDRLRVLKIEISSASLAGTFGDGYGSFPPNPPQDIFTDILHLEGISDLSVDMDGRLLVACGSANRLFLIDVRDRSGSQIAGDGTPVTTGTLVGSTNALSTQTTPFYVTASRYYPSVFTYNQGVGVSYVDRLFASTSVASAAVSISPSSIAEGDSEGALYLINVADNPSVWPVPFVVSLGGTATIGVDYVVSESATDESLYLIPGFAGDFLYPILFSILADTVTDPGEFFSITLVCPFTTRTDTISIEDVASSGSGDPHMIGFHGQSFDFVGRDQMTYNLLSDPFLQVNTKLGLQRTGENSFVPGPVMKTMAFLTSNHEIIVNSGGFFKDEIGFVTVDKQKLFDGQTVSLADDGLKVSFKKTLTSSRELGLVGNDKIVGSVEIILEGLYRFDVFFVENHGNPLKPHQGTESKWYRRFLNFKSALLDPERRPHGVLGQTAVPPSKERSLKEWQIQGSDNDYLVLDGLTGKKFAFNQFF